MRTKKELLDRIDNEIENCVSLIKSYERFIAQVNIPELDTPYKEKIDYYKAKIEAYEDVKNLIS